MPSGKRAAGFLIYRLVAQNIEYLLLKTSYGAHHWTPPKGHVDPGEDFYATALRETREESGYTESDLKIYPELLFTLNYQVNNKPKVVQYFLAELTSTKEPTLSDEHTEFRFLPKDEAIKISGFIDFAKMLEHFDTVIRKMHQL